MQLGELQHQHERFERRGVTVLALSVDEPAASLALISRLGLTFDLGSDPEQNVIKAFRVQNPDTRELAIHAVYILDSEGTVFYRKVGRRRPLSQELIDAIDASSGEYPPKDEIVAPRQRIAVAFPENNFQALLTATAVEALPKTIDQTQFEQVLALSGSGSSDDALVAFKALMADSKTASEEDLLDTAAWLTRLRFFTGKPQAIETGRMLTWRLGRNRALEAAIEKASEKAKDELTQKLAQARAGLSMTRAEIERHADEWRLRYVKTTLRGYREVAHAEMMMRASG